MSQDPRSRNENPGVKKRRLRLALRQARLDAGLTQEEAARKLSWSVNKVKGMEQGSALASPADVVFILAIYDVPDQQRARNLMNLAMELAHNTRTRITASEFQLREIARLKELATPPGDSIHRPMFLDTNPAMRGPFSLLEFGDDELPEVVYLERTGRETTLHDDEELETLNAYAHDYKELETLIERYRQDFSDS